MGMYEAGLRKAILTEVENYKSIMEEERAMAKKKGIDDSVIFFDILYVELCFYVNPVYGENRHSEYLDWLTLIHPDNAF